MQKSGKKEISKDGFCFGIEVEIREFCLRHTFWPVFLVKEKKSTANWPWIKQNFCKHSFLRTGDRAFEAQLANISCFETGGKIGSKQCSS